MVAGPYRMGAVAGGGFKLPKVSERVYVTLDRKCAGVDAAHDRRHIHRGLAGGLGPSGAGNRRREQREDAGGIHASVTSAKLVGLGHG
jgi:hypothetical protein